MRREVAEEVGRRVGEVRYLASQPWPFPASLMIGCTALACDPAITVDGVEITEARWFSRDELVADCLAGRLLVPPGISISRGSSSTGSVGRYRPRAPGGSRSTRGWGRRRGDPPVTCPEAVA